jgi:hypothetical protein
MNLNDVKHRHAERNAFLGASNAGRANPNGPNVGNFVEMPGRAARMSIWTLASHLVQAPAFAVAIVAIFLDELASIEVGSARALIVNIAVKRELRTPLLVQFWQRARVS